MLLLVEAEVPLVVREAPEEDIPEEEPLGDLLQEEFPTDRRSQIGSPGFSASNASSGGNIGPTSVSSRRLKSGILSLRTRIRFPRVGPLTLTLIFRSREVH